MTDSLIPYSFTPGTKAKAQEVNANFIALAESIAENTTTLNSSKLNKDLSNISQAGINAIKNNTVSPRNIGEIVTSTIPLTDAGLHLLDGALLTYGSYKAFIDYIADLYNSCDYEDIFETEANWQSAVTTYGVCGKFVYDSVNNTVRLPKYSNKIYTKDFAPTTPVKGNGFTLGLTNGSVNIGVQSTANGYAGTTNNYGVAVGTTGTGSGVVDGKTVGLTTNGSKSGIIADLLNITTPLDGYYYIVIANSTKTDIQVDIDEIVTDLNGKVDVDLTNVNNQGKILMAHNSMPSSTYEDLTFGANGSTYTAPADGWFYLSTSPTSSPGNYIALRTPTMSATDANKNSGYSLDRFVYAKKGDVMTLNYNNINTGGTFRFYYAIGSESEAN